VIDKLREIKPDIVVATGDIVDGQGDNLAALARHFQSYTPPLGAYAVTGNHETYAGLENSLRFLRNAGFTVLRGELVQAGGIVLMGVDDPSAATSVQPPRPDTSDALAPVTADHFIVLLKHQPVVDSDTPFDLQLSGHIHGGQIFPFVYLTRLSYGVRAGLTELADGRRLYVSRGAGTWGPPIRLFAPPEIAVITIASANRQSTAGMISNQLRIRKYMSGTARQRKFRLRCPTISLSARAAGGVLAELGQLCAGGFNRSTQQVGEIVVRVFHSLEFFLGVHLIGVRRR
jgi:hypothetical protein